MNKMKKVALVFVLILLFVPPTLTLLDLLSILKWGNSINSTLLNAFLILYTSTIPAIALKVLELFGCCSTPQPNSQSSGQSNPNPPSGTPRSSPRIEKIACGVGIALLLTIGLTFFIASLTYNGYFFYSMYLKPGIYVFMPNGNYYYYHPLGWPASNVTLIVLGGGNIDINDWAYPDTVTVQPGNYSFIITLTNPNTPIEHLINTIPTSALISLIITMILCELASRSEKH